MNNAHARAGGNANTHADGQADTRTDTSARARALFTRTTGREPNGVWSAPGRVNLIGEHTDYNEGFVLPFAIQQRTYAAAGLRSDDRIRVVSELSDEVVEVSLADLDDLFPVASAATSVSRAAGEVPATGLDTGSASAAAIDTTAASTASMNTAAVSAAGTHAAARLPEWSAYVLGVAWVLRSRRQALGHDTAPAGIDIAIASEVPVGAGLSSSAALESATASALNELWGTGFGPVGLAEAGRRAENEAVGAPTGIMDQLASMLGRPGTAILIDCRSLATQSVATGFDEAGLELLVIDTRAKHSHSNGGYRDRRAACERGAALLGLTSLRDASVDDLARAESLCDDVTFRRVRHVVTENQRVLDTVAALGAHGPRAIGELLLASHASMRDDFEISTRELDLAVDTAMEAGAVGARMTGGGFGGAAIALVDRSRVAELTAAVRSAFGGAGFADPHVFAVRPSEGSRRER